ncbi:MAG: dockerin type I repeat-containing protein [Planctomycetota bacterium]|nr:dockerin type I repeat-containing protein [Planctomycetota bacterium]
MAMNRNHLSGLGLAIGSMGAALGGAAAWGGPCSPAWAPGVGLEQTGSVQAFALLDEAGSPTLYAGGSLSGGVLRFDGTEWVALPGNPIAEVRGLAVFDDGSGPALYAAPESGLDTEGSIILGVARRVAGGWEQVGGALTTAAVNWLAVVDDGTGNGAALYALGAFDRAGQADAPAVAKWDGIAWSGVGNLTDGLARVAVGFDDGAGHALYVGGNFLTFGGVPANIAKFNGSTWSAVGGGLNGIVAALAVFDDGDGAALYAAGTVRPDGAQFPFVVRRWDGIAWTQVGNGFNGNIAALTVFDDGGGPALYAAGTFGAQITPEGAEIPISRVARWDGESWTGLASGVSANANAFLTLEIDGKPALLVGGSFDTAGGMPSENVGLWVGCAGQAVTGDLNGDGLVNAADLGALLGAWGTNDAGADLDGDGVVGAADLAILLGSWST